MNNTLGLSSLLTSMGSNQSSNDVGTGVVPNDDDQLQKMAQQQAYQNAINALSPSNTGSGTGMQDMSQISSIQAAPKQKSGGMDIGSMMSMAKGMQGNPMGGGMGAAGASGGAAGSMGAPSATGAISAGGGGAAASGGLSNTAVLAAESDKTSKESIRKLSAENKELKAEVKQNALENMYAPGDPLNMIMPTWDTSKPVAPPPPRRVIAAKPVAPPPPPPYVQEYGYFMPPPRETYSSYEPVSTMPNPPMTPAYNYSPPPPNMSAMPEQYSSSDESKKKDIKPVKGARLEGSEIQEFLDGIHPYSFKYKNPEDGSPVAPVDDRYLGVMAQDVEKTPTGNTLVKTDNRGKKMLEVAPMMSALAASAAYLNDRVKKLEDKKG